MKNSITVVVYVLFGASLLYFVHQSYIFHSQVKPLIKESLQQQSQVEEAEGAPVEQEEPIIDVIITETPGPSLPGWEFQPIEITGYSPLDPRAVAGMDYSGDPTITASGVKVQPGITAAAASDIPFGTRIFVDGYGMYLVHDRGGAIKRNEDGLLQVDLSTWKREEALEIGRRVVWAFVEVQAKGEEE